MMVIFLTVVNMVLLIKIDLANVFIIKYIHFN